MSIKKYAPYRKEYGWDPKRAERLKEFRDKVVERIPTGGTNWESNVTGKAKKRKGKKERMKLKAEINGEDLNTEVGASPGAAPTTSTGLDLFKRKRETEDEGRGTGKKRKQKRKAPN